ncbi:MAG TPA: YdhR family protein [Microlunatus sp.]|nr:YdhR family protein [Microlunatus sp.]
MHISVFEYRIRDIDDAGWAVTCDELAPVFAAVPGLITKYWLHGVGEVRGGVYVWTDREAYMSFLDSELGRALGTHPNIADLTMREYAVDEAPTRVTGGLATAVS